MRNGLWLLTVGGLLVASLAGCATPLGSTFTEPAIAQAETAKPISAPGAQTEWVRTKADASRVTTFQQVQQDLVPCAPPAPVYYPPAPAARQWSCCGLPCAEGFGNFHIRGLGGWAFHVGDETGEDCGYWGADIGWTAPCCWGLDFFYRGHGCEFDRQGSVASLIGTDTGTYHHIGLKGTYQSAFGGSKLYWYVGAGPQYFWTTEFVDNDSGWGVFGEVGLGYLLSRTWRIRAGVDFHWVQTAAGRLRPADDGEDRSLMFIAPNIGIEAAF